VRGRGASRQERHIGKSSAFERGMKMTEDTNKFMNKWISERTARRPGRQIRDKLLNLHQEAKKNVED
jgi:hypothetical protein